MSCVIAFLFFPEIAFRNDAMDAQHVLDFFTEYSCMVLAEGWIMENYLGWPCLLCLSRCQVCSVEVRDRTVVVKKFWQKIKAVQKPRELLLKVR